MESINIEDLSRNEIMFFINQNSNTASTSHQSSSSTNTTKFRWTTDNDETLLKEVIVEEPYKTKKNSKERKQAWETIASNVNVMVNEKVTSRACNERYEKLKDEYKKKEEQKNELLGLPLLSQQNVKIFWMIYSREREMSRS